MTLSKGTLKAARWWYGLVAKTRSTYLSRPKLLLMGGAARRRCTSRTWMTTGAWTSEQMPPKGPLGKTHHGKDPCSTAFACPWKRIQVCQVPCTPSEVIPLTNGMNMGQEQRLLGYG